MAYARCRQVSLDVEAPPERLFDYLDDQERLAAHMNKPSMMMLGGRMFYELDAGKGRVPGSVIRMGGKILWLDLLVEEVVTERRPPHRKVWETRGAPKLLVIGAYRMGFDIAARGEASTLSVFIDYDHPRKFAGRALAPLLAPLYAQWCVARMAKDAQRAFAHATGAAEAGAAR